MANPDSPQKKNPTPAAICANPDCTYPGTRPTGSACPRCGEAMVVVVSL